MNIAQIFPKMEKTPGKKINYEAIFQPETELEVKIIGDASFREGLNWGVPRFGHPEGEVYKHIREVLDNIDLLDISNDYREPLRIIALTHDTFKHKEDKSYPRDWAKHHGVYARLFMEQYTDDPAILDILELHDEAYYSWRLIHLYNRLEEGQLKLKKLLASLGPYRQLYYLFFKCDTETGDKNQAPLVWFERVVNGIDVLPPLR
jgi:hypothetical protein